MKRMMLPILAVLFLTTVAPAQKVYDVAALIVVAPTTVAPGQSVRIDVYLVNNGPRDLAIREVELYWGPKDHSTWGELLSLERLTIGGGQVEHLILDEQIPTTAVDGTWNIQVRFCFTGSGKRDMLTPPTTFTVSP